MQTIPQCDFNEWMLNFLGAGSKVKENWSNGLIFIEIDSN